MGGVECSAELLVERAECSAVLLVEFHHRVDPDSSKPEAVVSEMEQIRGASRNPVYRPPNPTSPHPPRSAAEKTG